MDKVLSYCGLISIFLVNEIELLTIIDIMMYFFPVFLCVCLYTTICYFKNWDYIAYTIMRTPKITSWNFSMFINILQKYDF